MRVGTPGSLGALRHSWLVDPCERALTSYVLDDMAEVPPSPPGSREQAAQVDLQVYRARH